jgi:hypothetical protein
MLRVIPALLSASILLASCLAPSRARAADEALLPRLTGHWRCAIPGGTVERSLRGTAYRGAAEFFERADKPLADGNTETSWEHAVRHAGETVMSAETPDGTGTGHLDATSLRIEGSTYAGGTPLALSYALRSDGTLLRTASSDGTTDTQTCTREPAPVVRACAQPDLPPTTLHALDPSLSADATYQRIAGTVVLRLVLDDRSNVLWADVIRSPSPLLNEASIQAVRGSTFRTEIRDCKGIPAEYVFTYEYSST